MLTIARFAERTGLSPSALRFYERKGLLVPARRLENGYRVYSPRQVGDAQLIHSLRQADVRLADIRHFLGLGLEERAALLARWRDEARARLLTVQLAEQYLQGLHPEGPSIHLHRWEKPSQLLWFPATAPVRPQPFLRAISERRRQLEKLGVPIASGGYVRTLDVEASTLVGEVGFRIEVGRKRSLPAQVRVQEVPPTLFASLECTADDDKAAHRVFRFLDHFGFTPSGLHLERYLLGAGGRYQLLLSVRPRLT
ncbi:MerR family DNA-binding transcriptional regulator [Archangium violaceum]|uniref:MerR family transcriptional regulator n=1 Tax=Archangium violaceum TaxID=83451 RepID=UPI00193AF336|nr:MerR family transcriptional regulator [Archangium violaceum]QRK10553.1 MerR family DNA-binding transcriptional regulator [Archangium violaceum]